jgi:hypothetical protein
VEALDQVTDPAASVLGGLHVGGQLMREMGQAVRQWIAERRQQAGKHQHGPGDHDGHRPAAAPDPPPLQRHHQGVQDHGEEPRNQYHQDDIA